MKSMIDVIPNVEDYVKNVLSEVKDEVQKKYAF